VFLGLWALVTFAPRLNANVMKHQFSGTPYKLQSIASGKNFNDEGWTLDAPGELAPTLIRALYSETKFKLEDNEGIYKFANWLPIQRVLSGSSAPVTYKSDKLGPFLGLKNLYITFSGFWPEKGCFMSTCSFKETEAYTVCGRMKEGLGSTLVVASAGNTARAFAKVCSENEIPLVLCVPFDNLNALWFEKELNKCVKLIATAAGSDYFDAIHLSNIISSLPGYLAEGGAKNVARRDGMGTTVLSAVEHIGTIPDYYFQAVGSGTGAIAAWEANLRFLEDGSYGKHKMKLIVSQNAPFTPIYDAWKAGSRSMLPYDDAIARKHVEEIDAKVLSNRKPPYPITGGLFDALIDTNGDVLKVENMEARLAAQLFKDLEGIDIHPAAGVAVASLIQAAPSNDLDPDAIIMLNITGGGEERFKKDKDLCWLKPWQVVSLGFELEDVKKILNVKF
jgi:cysteate synthase